jgi:hypothetical protein
MGPAGPSGLGLSFVYVDVTGSGPLVLPAGNASVIYTVQGGSKGSLVLTLPSASDGRSRFVTIRGGKGSSIRPAPGDTLDAGGDKKGAVAIDGSITLVSDGSKWVVFARTN